MQINYIQAHANRENVKVNGTTVGYVYGEPIGSKTNWQGFIGETRIFTGIRSKKAAMDEMLYQIVEIHRKFTRAGSNLDQSRNPLKHSSK